MSLYLSVDMYPLLVIIFRMFNMCKIFSLTCMSLPLVYDSTMNGIKVRRLISEKDAMFPPHSEDRAMRWRKSTIAPSFLGMFSSKLRISSARVVLLCQIVLWVNCHSLIDIFFFLSQKSFTFFIYSFFDFKGKSFFVL